MESRGRNKGILEDARAETWHECVLEWCLHLLELPHRCCTMRLSVRASVSTHTTGKDVQTKPCMLASTHVAKPAANEPTSNSCFDISGILVAISRDSVAERSVRMIVADLFQCSLGACTRLSAIYVESNNIPSVASAAYSYRCCLESDGTTLLGNQVIACGPVGHLEGVG